MFGAFASSPLGRGWPGDGASADLCKGAEAMSAAAPVGPCPENAERAVGLCQHRSDCSVSRIPLNLAECPPRRVALALHGQGDVRVPEQAWEMTFAKGHLN